MTTFEHFTAQKNASPPLISYPSPSSLAPADRRYLKLWSAFVGVSPLQNHSYLQRITYTQNRGTMYKQQSEWFDLLYSSFCWCFFFCARKWRSTAPSRLRRTCCGLPRSSPRSCICRCISSRMTRRRCSLPELSIRSLWLKVVQNETPWKYFTFFSLSNSSKLP